MDESGDKQPFGEATGVWQTLRESCEGRFWVVRVPILLWLIAIGLHHLQYHAIAYPGGSVCLGLLQSPFLLLDMTVHEMGHFFFGTVSAVLWRCDFLVVLGGTLFQVGLPMLAMAMFWRQRDLFGVAVGGVWLGTTLYHVQWYISDARAQLGEVLEILGDGVTYTHDWNYMLGRLGWLEWDLALGKGLRVLACLTLWSSVISGAWILWLMIRLRNPTYLPAADSFER